MCGSTAVRGYTVCPECNEVVQEKHLVVVEPEKLCYHNKVCSDCYDNLESE